MPSWKIVVLDEADMMTYDAQSALRRIIEDQSKSTRFVIICNYVSKIIGPISSRCANYRFEPISREAQKTRLSFICQKEGLSASPDALQTILDECRGDLRIGVTLLQTSARLFEDKITIGTIQQVSGSIPDEVVDQILDCARKSTSVDPVVELITTLVANGWDANRLLFKLNRRVAHDDTMKDVCKAKIALHLGVAQHNLLEGANETLMLLTVATQMQQNLQST
eukprot:Selendium_serpulae@DN6038_c0_g1_i9.p1